MAKEFIKITFEDIEIAERFFDNKNHLTEFLSGVIDYYRGVTPQIKTKIVSKYFETYKKTMDFILESKTFGFKGHKKKAEYQQVKECTLEGVVKGVVKATLPTNNKLLISNNKVISIIEKPVLFTPLENALNDFYVFRKELKKPILESSKDALRKKLIKLSNNDNEIAIEIINQSIANGWQGIFELKTNQNGITITKQVSKYHN